MFKKRHPRSQNVTRASIKLSLAVSEIQVMYDLTTAELIKILVETQLDIATQAVRIEREAEQEAEDELKEKLTLPPTERSNDT